MQLAVMMDVYGVLTHEPLVMTTLYVPAWLAANEAMTGSRTLLVKPFGPVQR